MAVENRRKEGDRKEIFVGVSSRRKSEIVEVCECMKALERFAVFVGLFLTTPGQPREPNRLRRTSVAKKLLVFEVVSFSFFLFSSLVAQGLKLAINLLNSKDADEAFRAHINLKALRFGMLGSAVGSVMGCLFFDDFDGECD